MKSSKRCYPVVLVLMALLAVLLRLPQFLGGHLIPDGDESIVGLMAKHITEGQWPGLFFWGQQYGLCVFEFLTAALFFLVFGISGNVLKISMLFMWLIGLLFMALAVRHFKGSWSSIVTSIIMVSFPAWASWSMKARGGYISAFVFSNLALWLVAIAASKSKNSWQLLLGLGSALGIIALAQPLWLFATVPFLGLLISKDRHYQEYLWVLIGMVGTVAIIYLPGYSDRYVQWSPAVFDNANIPEAFGLLKSRLLTVFSGSFYLARDLKLNNFTQQMGWVGLILTICIVIYGVYKAIKDRTYGPLAAATVGTLSVIAATLFMNDQFFGFRYLLPVTGLLAVSIGLSFNPQIFYHRKVRLWGWVIGLGLLPLAWFSHSAFDILTYNGLAEPNIKSESAVLKQLFDNLYKKHVAHVYCLHPMFQWNLTFLSGEAVVARWHETDGRAPEFPRQVDNAHSAGEKVALIGFNNQLGVIEPWLEKHPEDKGLLEHIQDRYFIFYDPTYAMLKSLGFRIIQP